MQGSEEIVQLDSRRVIVQVFKLTHPPLCAIYYFKESVGMVTGCLSSAGVGKVETSTTAQPEEG